jgi:uncharacterized protein YndB with AHSA1/START domain
MKKIIKSIVLLLVVAVAVVVGGAYVIPPVAHVERAIAINAPPEKIFPIVSDMRRFNEWSPWYAIDPAADYRFEGPEQGVGQKMVWSSAKPEVGKGSQTIVELEVDRKIVTEIDFATMGKARSVLSLAPIDTGTSVVWTFETPADGIMERWASLMFDSWIGADYVKGLSLLKQLAESEGKT